MVQRSLKEAFYATAMFNDVKTSHMIYGESYALEINLKKFERSEDGKDLFGELAFDIKFISPENSILYSDTMVKKVKIEDRDFLNLAKGMSTALSEAVGEVTGKLTEILKNQKG